MAAGWTNRIVRVAVLLVAGLVGAAASSAQTTNAANDEVASIANAALESARERLADEDPEGAVEILGWGMESILAADPSASLRSAWYAYIGQERARYQQRLLRDDDAALSSLAAVELVLGDSLSDAIQHAGVAAMRGQIQVDRGVLDQAGHELRTARGWIDKAIALGAEPQLERIAANRLEATLLEATEQYNPMIAMAQAAIEDEALYADHPADRARLMVKLGFAYTNAQPDEYIPESSEWLERALAVEQLNPAAAVMALLGLSHGALLQGDPNAAATRLKTARVRLAALARSNRAREQWTAWSEVLTTQLWLYRFQQQSQLSAWPPWRTVMISQLCLSQLTEQRVRLERAFMAKVAAWEATEVSAAGQGFLHFVHNKSLLAELVRTTILLDPSTAGVEQALGHLLRAQDVTTLARRMGARRTSLDDVQNTLLESSAKRAILAYFPAEFQSHLFVLAGDEIEYFALASSHLIKRAQKALATSMSSALDRRPQFKQRERSASQQAVANYLLPAHVRERIAGFGELILVGHDLLGEAFVEAWPDGENGSCLGTTRALSYLPSLSVGVALARRADSKRAEGGKVLVVGAPEYSDRLGPNASGSLGDAESLEWMLEPYPKKLRTIVSGRAATLTALHSAVGTASVLQVFTHGYLASDRERPATFLLTPEEPNSPNGVVGADEIERLGIDVPQLVLLTVCGSGRAPIRRGDAGAAGLAGSLLESSSRARCVVLTSASLDTNAARRFSRYFHQALWAGASPAEAARVARAALAASPGFADPFHHALIRVVGLAHDPLFER